jgi:polysaccharide export outer membrane protein
MHFDSNTVRTTSPSRILLRVVGAIIFLGGCSHLAAQNSSACVDPLSSACIASGGNSTSNNSNNSNMDALQGGGLNSNALSNALSQRSEQSGQVYVDAAGNRTQQNPNTQRQYSFPPDPVVDIQRLAHASTGELLPVFGRDLFQTAPSTFAPADQIPAVSDYVVGPGDMILLRLWGPESFNGQLTVDSTGSIYVPQVGAIHVAGLRVDQLQSQITEVVKHTFRNFNLSVNMGHLRSIQVYVVGEARRPGAYTVSSLSTVLNVLFTSGGPNVQGSMRHIQIRRKGAVIGELDLYDLILNGDKSHDLRLEPEDTIFIPAVGPQAALAGSIHRPAIYELRDGTTIAAILALGGGFTPTSSTSQLSLERIEQNNARAAMTINLDSSGRATPLRDGDVVFVSHITSAYQQSVTIRGNLANPGRFPWHPGMHLSDIIPDKNSLLTTNYWQQRNRLGVPVPMFEPIRRPQTGQAGQTTSTPGTTTTTGNQTADQQSAVDASQAMDASGLEAATSDLRVGSTSRLAAQRGAATPGQSTGSSASEPAISSGSVADSDVRTAGDAVQSRGRPNLIVVPAPEIDWSYAVIERQDPESLKSTLVPFNLERLLRDHDASQNLELRAGDIVTILSQADIKVSQDEQTKYIRLEGEFNSSGVYSVGPNETLDELVARAGGVTTKAYLYGASFTRESSRVFQQQRLDEYINSVSLTMQRAVAVQAASSQNATLDPNALAEQREIVAQMRKLRSTGRIVLEFHPDSQGMASIPHIPLEDGDIFRIPSRPLTVNVIGAVYGQNVFLYNSKRRLEDYLLLAGKPNQIADRKHAFIIRADGSVYSRERAQGVWKNSFEAAQINPGDSIVVPEKPIRPTFIRQFIDYTQIFEQFALGAAAIAVIKQ